MEEYEMKFLNIDVPALEARLLSIGATRVAEYFYQIALFDYSDLRLNADHSWVRLRSDGVETTLAYKQALGVKTDTSASDDGMKEVEVVVDDFDKTYEIFKSIGFVTKREEEKKRIRYIKGSATFDIDFWPEIPPYIEIEGNSMDEVCASARELGFDPEEGLIGAAGKVYAIYGMDTSDYSSIKFSGLVKK